MLLPVLARTALQPVERPALATPFGPLTFETAVGDTVLPPLPDELFELPGGGTVVARWSRPAARVELLLTAYDPDLDPEAWGPLTGCQAAVWRIDALVALTRVRFEASLPARLAEGADAYWDGGQALAAITVEDERTRLTVGGHDEEAICWAGDAHERPRRWAALLDEVCARSFNGWGVDFGDHRGMAWTLPPLGAGEHCELPVVAAWGSADDGTENTWCAVIPSPTVLLRQVADRARLRR
ncbi:hypothetical protein GCM10009639_34990 [Kitasatospora putterlickiae]|uniref:DUF317 domain-containing protein n=1 Tax=Kitasatospora putterlickiae TaxID=221725 RepID=A0ABN1Y4C0_9ACTN